MSKFQVYSCKFLTLKCEFFNATRLRAKLPRASSVLEQLVLSAQAVEKQRCARQAARAPATPFFSQRSFF